MARPKKCRKADAVSEHGSDRKQQSGPPRRRLGAIVIIGLIAIGGVWTLRAYFVPAAPASVVAETAAEAPGEIAELLYEVEDVVLEFCGLLPGTVDALDAMAMLHSRFGKVEEAAGLWKECTELDPAFVNAHFQLGLIERDQGRNAEATRHFRQAARLDPNASHLAIHLAKSLVSEGSLEEAVEILEAERQKQPDSVATLAVLGDAYLQLRQYEKARDVLTKTVALAPGLASPHYGLGMSCVQLGDRETAKKQMAIFQKLKARDEQAHRDQLKDTQLGLHNVQSGVAEIETNVAKAYIASGVPQKAEELLERAAQLDPSSPEPARVLAWLLQREGRVDDAVKVLTRAAAALPDDFSVHLGLGQLLTQIGRLQEAEQSFLRMVELTPNKATAHAMLGEFYLQAARKPAKAEDAAQRAVDLAPTADHYFLLARACYDSGELERASEAVDRAIALQPERGEYLQLRSAIRGG